jgi:hypothetical protein
MANAFVLNPESLVFRRSSRDHNIMFVEEEATIRRLTNVGPTPTPGNLQLHCRRWSRQSFADGIALPVLANIELRGIPEHAWEMSIAESLLSPYGWPHLLQPETRNKEDYSAFCLTASVTRTRQKGHVSRVRDVSDTDTAQTRRRDVSMEYRKKNKW